MHGASTARAMCRTYTARVAGASRQWLAQGMHAHCDALLRAAPGEDTALKHIQRRVSAHLVRACSLCSLEGRDRPAHGGGCLLLCLAAQPSNSANAWPHCRWSTTWACRSWRAPKRRTRTQQR